MAETRCPLLLLSSLNISIFRGRIEARAGLHGAEHVNESQPLNGAERSSTQPLAPNIKWQDRPAGLSHYGLIPCEHALKLMLIFFLCVMRLSNCRHILFLLLCFTLAACKVSCVESKRGKVTEKVIVSDAKQIINLNLKEGQEYIVDGIIDLKGGNAVLPANVLISFKKSGAIVNGTLTGNRTRIISDYESILGVHLKGTWCVDKISDLSFSQEFLSDDDIIHNLNIVQSDTVFNKLTIHRDYQINIPQTGGYALSMSSNSSLQLKSTLALVPIDYAKYNIILIENKENVSVTGGSLVGDVGNHRYIDGTTSEWGMGISILNSRNVTVSDINISGCIGDGIYISGGNESSVGIYEKASKNVTITNVICDGNRRQGLSIIHVDGLTVKDCSFINTGQIESTPPSAGIDIEPNSTMSVRNVLIENCTIINNKGMAVATNNTYENGGKVNYENIVFSNCYTDGLLKAQSDDLLFRKCTFKEIRFASVYAPTHISFEDCVISGGYGIIIYAPSKQGVDSKNRLLSVDFKNCTLSTSEHKTATNALISCYKNYISNIEYISFDGCRLIIPRTKGENYSITDNDFNRKLRINNSIIDMKGRSFYAAGIELTNSKIVCKKVYGLLTNESNIIDSDMQ